MAKRICKLHGEPLVHDRVEIRFGMPPGPPPVGRGAAEPLLFPNAKFFVFGGCLVPENDLARVYFCPACRSAEREWQSSREVDEFWKV